MTPMEMFDELVDDALKVSRKIEYLIPEYRRNVLKRTSFPVIFKPIDYLSPRKNNWIIVFRAENKKDADKIAITYVCTATPPTVYTSSWFRFLTGWFPSSCSRPIFFKDTGIDS